MTEPYYQDKMVTIYHGDCAEIVPELGRFDLLLTDPPYGLSSIMVGGSGFGWGMFMDEYNVNGWDDSTTDTALHLSISKCENSVVWGGNYYFLPPARCWLAWDKVQAFTGADFEMAWTTIDKPCKSYRMSRVEAYGSMNKAHPTQKPEGLMTWCIKQAGGAESILDPFMGSGTTLVAARRNGIRSVGIDREEKYCEIAAQRISQMSLFE